MAAMCYILLCLVVATVLGANGASVGHQQATISGTHKGLPAKYHSLVDDLRHLAVGPGASYAPILVRLAWHCSGSYSRFDHSGGSDGARMRFHPEKDWGANKGLQVARDALEPLKAKYPWVTYADLYTLAGAVAIEATGGPHIPWRPGRMDAGDGATSPADGRLPDASKHAEHVRDVFQRLGFGDEETVALIGAHTLGRCHVDRSGYEGPWTPQPLVFSNDYFALLQDKWVARQWDGPQQYELAGRTAASDPQHVMMTPADLALVQDERFKHYVKEFAHDKQAFFEAFARAFSRLLELGVEFPPEGGAAPQ